MATQTRELPTGELTFFFSDIQGSTGLLQRLGRGYHEVLEQHARIVRAQLAAHGGTEVSTEGDSFFAVFPSAEDAVTASAEIQQALASEPWPDGGTVAVRIGLHTGTADLGHDNYIGMDVNRAARISAAGHGGQVVTSLAVRERATGAAFVDLGEHALKGLEDRMHLFQLEVAGLPQGFPPLRTERSKPNNLPALASRIVGRDAELAAVQQLFNDHRLVTLAGPGGIGKTRLALEVAQNVADRFDLGAYFVDLAPIDDAELVIPEIAATVGIDTSANGGLGESLSDGPRLLVLDNLEQVVDAAPALSDLLATAPPLKVLGTSQVPLRVAGEYVIRLAPLESGDADSPAVRLFATRATQADPAFDIEAVRDDVVALVAQLGGVPLAIELAAARANVLTPAQIAERLDRGVLKGGRSDAPDRHRSLAAAVEWSVGLLTAEQQGLLRALSVFRGAAALAAIEAVSHHDPLEDLAELVDRSLVTAETGEMGRRFDLLDPVRKFVRETGNDLDELTTRHARYFADLAASARNELDGDRRARWLAALGDDHDNIRATLDYLLDVRDLQKGFGLLGNIWRFYQSTGQLNELELWLDRYFDADTASEPTLARARALVARAALHYWRAQWEAGAADYEAALAIAEKFDDRPLMAEVLAGLTSTRGNAIPAGLTLGDPMESAKRAHEIYTELGDTSGMVAMEFGRIIMEAVSGPEPAPPPVADLQHLVDMQGGSGNLMGVAHTLNMIGETHLINGDYGLAADKLIEALDMAEEAGDTFTMMVVLRWLAVTIVEQGDAQLGAQVAGAAAHGLERSGGDWPPPFFPIESAEDRARRLIGEDADAIFDEGREMGLFEAIRRAREAATAG